MGDDVNTVLQRDARGWSWCKHDVTARRDDAARDCVKAAEGARGRGADFFVGVDLGGEVKN